MLKHVWEVGSFWESVPSRCITHLDAGCTPEASCWCSMFKATAVSVTCKGYPRCVLANVMMRLYWKGYIKGAPQVAEAANWRAVGACEELEEAPALLVVKLPDSLPQPLHHLVARSTVSPSLGLRPP